ncbi:MAG: protein serine/threonine phosphatase [Bacteroidetes bacterium]|nr:MAG: protein serine/threonine phosphatase [Bacteroidota bacterium]
MNEDEIKKYPAGSRERIVAVTEYVFENRRKIPAEGLKLIQELEHDAHRLGDKKVIAELLKAKAWCYYYCSDDEQAVEVAMQGAHAGEEAGSVESMFRNLIIVSYCFARLGDMKQALDVANRCSELLDASTEKNVQLEGIMHSVYASLYFQLEDSLLAKEHNEIAIACFRNPGFENNLAGQINNLGNVEKMLGNLDRAMACYEEAIDYYREHGEHILWGNALINIGTVFADRGDREKQTENFKLALDLYEKINYQFGIMYAHLMLGKTYVTTGNFDIAEKHLDEAERLAISMKSEKNSALILEVLADLEKSRGDYKKAFEYFTEFHTLQNKLLHSKSITQARNQQIISRLTNAEKERELFRLKNIDLVKLNNEINQKNKDILDSISYSRRIQHAMLPHAEVMRALLPDSFVLYQPRDVVSGDFYWAGNAGNTGEVIVAVADCTGHGVPGALLSMLGISLLNEIIIGQHIHSPAEILDALRTKILSSLAGSQASGTIQDGMDIMCCRIDPVARKIFYSGANQRMYLLRGKSVMEFRGDKQPIGAGEWKPHPFSEGVIELLPGDVIYLMTDGLADQFGGPDSKKLKYKGVEALLASLSGIPVQEQPDTVTAFLSGWKHELVQTDDICLAGLSF